MAKVMTGWRHVWREKLEAGPIKFQPEYHELTINFRKSL